MIKINPHHGVLQLSPYVGGDASLPASGSAEEQNGVIRMMSNENPFGCSDNVKTALRNLNINVAEYPSSSHLPLRLAIAKIHAIPENNIACGNGSDNLIHITCQAYLQAGDETIYTKHGFLVYPIATQAAGGTPIAVAETSDLKADFNAILDAVTDKTKIVFLANPNNPTGTYIVHDELVSFRQKLREDILLVLDSAYAEYVTATDYDSGIKLVQQFDNVLMLRTFSKIYGLAALRVGWGYAHTDIIDVINRVREPFNLNSIAQICGIAAVSDQQFVSDCRNQNEKLRILLSEKLSGLGYSVIPSQANFILWHLGDQVNAMYDTLCQNGIYVRKVKAYQLPQYLRVSIGNETQCQKFLDVVKTIKS